jgi:hypothetical protein
MNKLVLIAAACLAGALPLWPSSAVRLDFSQLSRQADQVVAGKIIEIASELEPKTGLIYSRVVLSAVSAIPAPMSGKPYEFRMVGGEYGGRKLWIAGFPELKTGQEVVLFLARETAAVFGPTVGLWQGVYFVERGGGSGAEQVLDPMRRPVLGVRGGDTILGLEPSRPAGQAEAKGTSPLGVKEFMEAVLAARSVAAGSGALARD